MSVKQMLRYWDPEKILVRDEDLTILQGVQGPEAYHYYVRMERANVELEFHMEPMNKELLTDAAVRKFEQHLQVVVDRMQDDLVNQDAPDQEWKNRKK